MKLSIIHCTRRLGGLDILTDSLSRQTTLHDLSGEVELIIVDEHCRDEKRRQAIQRVQEQLLIPIHVAYPPDYDEPMYGKLSRSCNVALSIATGDILWFVNDNMWLPSDCLARMLATLDSLDHEALLTTICHHSAVPTLDDVGDLQDPYSIFKAPFHGDDYGFPDVEVTWRDPRVDQDAVSINPFMWEANVAMAKASVIRKIGQWPEDFDRGIGADNVFVAAVAMQATPGTKVVVLKDMVVLKINHHVLQPEPKERPEAEARNQRLLQQYFREGSKRKPAPKEGVYGDAPIVGTPLNQDFSDRFGPIMRTSDDLWFCQTRESYLKFYEHLTKPRHDWDPTKGASERHQWFLANLALLKPGMKVLDIGCHQGETLVGLTQQTQLDCYGIELMPACAQKCRDLGLNVVDGFAEDLPYPDQTFNAVVMGEILEHVADPDVVLREALRVLVPGGLVLITVPFGPWHLGNDGSEIECHVREINPMAFLPYGDYHVFSQMQWQFGYGTVGSHLVRFQKAIA